MGALTRLVRAEERVAAKIPAVTSGPQAETISITCMRVCVFMNARGTRESDTEKMVLNHHLTVMSTTFREEKTIPSKLHTTYLRVHDPGSE